MNMKSLRRSMLVFVTAALLVSVAVEPASALSVGGQRGNDYNVDGIGDFVAVSSVDHCLYRWNGNGAGAYGNGARDLCNQGANDYDLAAVGDISGGGIGDVVTINRNDLCLYRWNGNPDGNFVAPQRVGCGWGPYAGSIAGAGDLNGDGVGDLVAVNANDNCLYLWKGIYGPGGGLSNAQVVGCGWGPYRSFITGVGDVTRDGKADLVAVNGDTGCLNLWRGTGTGGFETAKVVGCGWDPYLPALAGAGDLNRDGIGDIVAINRYDNCMYRWSGTGTGGFGGAVRLGCGWGPYLYSVAN
jgi:hypothetical protein